MAQPGNLTALWAGPDNSRLTSKQYSFRLPVHVAAKIAALEEMYPQRSRTQIVGDLLSAALEGVEVLRQVGRRRLQFRWSNSPATDRATAGSGPRM